MAAQAYSWKELASRGSIGVALGCLAMLLYRGLPANAEQTASVIVAGVVGGLLFVVRGLTRMRRIELLTTQQSAEPKRFTPDWTLWALVGVIILIFVALFIWVMLSAMQQAA